MVQILFVDPTVPLDEMQRLLRERMRANTETRDWLTKQNLRRRISDTKRGGTTESFKPHLLTFAVISFSYCIQ